jgi:hypothetical protein
MNLRRKTAALMARWDNVKRIQGVSYRFINAQNFTPGSGILLFAAIILSHPGGMILLEGQDRS